VPKSKWREQHQHDRTDRCTAINEHGYICCALIQRRVWTFWKAWNEKRDGDPLLTCCGCMEKAFRERRAAA
jgi:hypothetical protein